jgi:hypothetical protein
MNYYSSRSLRDCPSLPPVPVPVPLKNLNRPISVAKWARLRGSQAIFGEQRRARRKPLPALLSRKKSLSTSLQKLAARSAMVR